MRTEAWTEAHGFSELATAADDMMRFNEAIDQAIAESVDFYSQEVDRGRHLFLGILGHDLRSPLSAILMTARYLSQVRSDEAVSTAARRLIDSGARMEALLDDLLDYSRATLQFGIPIDPTPTDLGLICTKVLDEVKTARPARSVTLQITGDASGVWDAKRLQQVLCNLVLNALDHGASADPVRVQVTGSSQAATIAVVNAGVAIPPSVLLTIFDPLRRGAAERETQSSRAHLGLGLFVAREIVRAHGGTIDVTSDERETVFAIRLPKQSLSMG